MKVVRQTRKQRQTGLRQRDRNEGSETDTQAETDRPEDRHEGSETDTQAETDMKVGRQA